jgi:hypothetical protein
VSAHQQQCIVHKCGCALSWNDAVSQAGQLADALASSGYSVPPNRELELLRKLEQHVRGACGNGDCVTMGGGCAATEGFSRLLVELDAVRAHG